MQKILTSAGMIVFAAALVVGATGAFFSDTETSTGNTFTAGALDLKVDSEAHYNGSICTLGNHDDSAETEDTYQWVGGQGYPVGLPCEGTWAETDLGASHKFFKLTDIKPGDEGENTISLHVYDNDAWGRFLVTNVQDDDNDCTEPETETILDPECDAAIPGTDLNGNGAGELAESIAFNAWLDQGSIAGFQCNNPGDEAPAGAGCPRDPQEGNNIQDCEEQSEGCLEQLFWTGETVDEVSEGPFNLSTVLGTAYSLFCAGNQGANADGHNNYGPCHGLAQDGRMVGSVTYYFGLGWSVPESVGNEAQTDSLETDLEFEVEQHRNNPTPFI